MHTHRLIFDASGTHFCGLRTPDAELARRWEKEAPANAIAAGRMIEPIVLHFEPAHGEDHGDEIIRSVHRLHVDHTRNSDGSIDVRGIYHYPDKDADDTSGPHPLHPLLSKRQAAKIPLLISKTHRVIREDEK